MLQLQESAAEHRRQGERDEQAHRHRKGHDEPEAREESPDDPADERDR